MSLSFVGQYSDRSWIETGLVGLDIATGKTNRLTGEVTLGIPTRIGIHLYGMYKVGKSHTALSLAGILSSRLNKSIVHVPIDTFDDNALEILEWSGMTINPQIVFEDEDYKSLDRMSKVFAQEDICVGILDSVMAVSPISEQEGSVQDANMGRRAKIMSAWVKQMFHVIKHSKDEKIFIATNHLFPTIGSIPGTYTPGGRTLLGFTSLHIKLTQARKGMKPVIFEGARLLTGKVEKANFGPEGKEFNLFIIGGLGIHRGLTAVYDCLKYELAEEVKGVVYLQGDKVGKIKNMYEDFQTDTVFVPFHKVLEEHKMDLAAGKSVGKKSKQEDDEELDEKELAKTDELYEG